MPTPPRVAISQDFLLELGKLPAAMHGRVVKWMLKFQQDPTSNGINYEAINAARDHNLRSVRIDQDWRGIVFRPERGDLFILLHLGHHDEAYRWAERRKLTVNPATGALQVVALQTVDAEPVAAQVSVPVVPALFRALADKQLLQLGAPEELIPMIRAMHSEADLDAAESALPVEAYEALFLLLAGDTVNTILAERETRVDRKVDTADFATALEQPESQSRFVVVTDDRELAAILNAPLAQWRVFLHPTQRKLAAGDRSGPVRVLGGAGTGKTVVAMHRAKWLVRNRTRDGRKVLFITFTRNLALDIEHNLQSLLPDPADSTRIEITNLDRWVHGYLRNKDYDQRIVYTLEVDLWTKALQLTDPELGLGDAFYADEWEHVIAAQGIRDLDAYRRASRVGRGGVLSRGKRDRVWPVFEEYRALLASRKLKDVDDAYGDAAALLSKDANSTRYAGIVVDETQDFGPQALRLLRAMIPSAVNDLFFVGDGHQRIYGKHKAVMSRCGIDIRGRSRKLCLNYRTTDEIRRYAVALLEGRLVDDLDGGTDDNRRYKSLAHGPAPEVLDVSDLDSAVDQVVRHIKAWQSAVDGRPMPALCVMTYTKSTRDLVAKQLRSNGIESLSIEADAVDTSTAGTVYISTMHRAKGLEFDGVMVLALDRPKRLSEDDASKLLYVALTRAKSRALLIRCA